MGIQNQKGGCSGNRNRYFGTDLILNFGGCTMLNAKKTVTSLMMACALALPVVGTAILPAGQVYAADASGTTASISDILKNQRPDGGWRKDYKETSGEWAKSTIDNKATYSEIRRLASEFKKTNNPQYSAAAIKGINFLLNMQYANGGWPNLPKLGLPQTHHV